MTEPSGRDLLSMADEVSRAMARYHSGRPAFYALSKAQEALKDAARQVAMAEDACGPRAGPTSGIVYRQIAFTSP